MIAQQATFRLYDDVRFVRDQHTKMDFVEQVHCHGKNNPLADMLLHSDT